MTVQTDKQQIDNMFRSEDFVYDESLNVDRQILYAQDTNNGTYGTTGLRFDLSSLKSKLTCLSEARIAGTLVITNKNGADNNGILPDGNIQPAQTFPTPTHQWASEPLLGWSFGEMGIFNGITLRTSDGTTILNNQLISLRNYFRYLLSHTRTHDEGQGAENTGIVKSEMWKHLFYSPQVKTQTAWSTASLTGRATGATEDPSLRNWFNAAPNLAMGTLGEEFAWNRSVTPDQEKRINQFRDSSYYDGRGRVYVNFDIALADLDPIFENLDFLNTNIGYELVLNFSWAMEGNWKVLDVYGSQTVERYSLAATPTVFMNTLINTPLNYDESESVLNAWIPQIDISQNGELGYRSVRLYYPTVTPNAVELDKINTKLAQGWLKNIEYFVPAQRLWSVGTDAATIGSARSTPFPSLPQFSQVINTSCVLPQKIHVCVVPKGAFNNTITWQNRNLGSTFNAVKTQMAGVTTPVVFGMPFKNISLEIDDQRYHEAVPRTALEKWWLMKENLIDKAESSIFDPLMNQGDFLGDYMGWITFDTSRLQRRIINPLAAVPIRLTFDFGDETIPCSVATIVGNDALIPQQYRKDFKCSDVIMQAFLGGSFEVYVIIEKLMKLKMDISKSESSVILGVNN